MRIAFLEDDLPQAEVLKDWLAGAGYSCLHFETAKSFLRAFRQESFDLLVLDWELPESSGFEVLGWVREYEEWRIPILFVTHRDSEEDIVAALSAGADDYMIKPVSREVTLARVGALARRSGVSPDSQAIRQVGDFKVLVQDGAILYKDQPVDLTGKEFKLAMMLFGNVGRLLSRNHMLETVWGVGPELATRTVDTHISRIRRKLRLTPEFGWKLKAVYHHGYRLEQMVQGQ
ncbi:MAG: response regulator transcription factor [Gammaproteobacteria bacterium]|nr:response regulator transcription factor [Gammaproteobacteria bacterium]